MPDWLKYNGVKVSIHAPAGGATKKRKKKPRRRPFQFTLPRGERQLLALANASGPLFQFTLPRGERLRLSCVA